MGNQILPSHKSSGEAVWLHSEKALGRFLKDKGISIDRFGKGSAKSLAHLLYELRSQACFLEPQTPEHKDSGKPRVLRIVEPVFIRLCWRCHVLVQVAQKLTDGRTRTRKMLLAEKKEPCDGGGLFATIVRALHEELGLDSEKLQKPGALNYRADAYHFELEQINSPSYPGLVSMYRTHHVMVDIPDESLDIFRECGLPDFRDFVTLETTEVGTTAHSWRWYDMPKALQEKVVKFPPQALSSNTLVQHEDSSGLAAEAASSWRTLSMQELQNEEELTNVLVRAGISPDLYGKGNAKTVGSLLKEVQKGDSSLEWHGQNNALRRVAEPVFIQFRWRDRILVEVEQRFTDGRQRVRNMLLAEKKCPEDQDVCATAMRGLREELNLAPEFPALEGLVHFMQEAYCSIAEHLESSSYPGLSCVYVTHYCAVQILDAGVPHFRALGMLEDEFETAEPDKVNRWRWTRVEEARSSKAKGFPELKDHKGGSGSSGSAYEPMESVPLDPASLRVLLEVGGVNVRAWGEYAPASLRSLARELEGGAAQLERNPNTGQIRRVLQSNLVQLMIEDADGSHSVESPRGLGGTSSTASSSWRANGASPGTNFGMKEARDLVQFRSDLACFEVVHGDTASYPGLPCCHQTRLVQFDHRDAGAEGRVKASPTSGAAGGAGRRASVAKMGSTASAAAPLLPLRRRRSIGGGLEERSAHPRLLDDFVTGRRTSDANVTSPSSDANSGMLVLPFAGQSPGGKSRKSAGGYASSTFRHISILLREDGLPMSPSNESCSSGGGSPTSTSPKRRSLYRELRHLQQHLRFPMVANEGRHEKIPPAEHAVTCACEIQLIRNINPLSATFHCRFYVFLEWIDTAAVGLPAGPVAPEKQKELSIPEIAPQNTLATAIEVHSPPEVVNPETGHVACKVLFQALMQMELNMRLFPFDAQRLVLVLGLRARRDRSRMIFCQHCNVDRQIRLDEWCLTSSFGHADRPDGRARVQFGVVISRAYWHYLVNVLGTLVGIATMALCGFLLDMNPPFDRLRFGVAVLFAQTTFRLSIENKLPKVSYSTAFDQYAIFCQLLVLTIMSGNALASILEKQGYEEVAMKLDHVCRTVLGAVWILGNAGFAIAVRWSRRRQHGALEQLSDKSSSDESSESTPQAQWEAEVLKAGLHYCNHRLPSHLGQEVQPFVRAVSMSTRVWLLHDIDPVSATFECKFTVHLEWLQEGAIGFPENENLTRQQLKGFDPPELDVHNKVELLLEEEPRAYVVDSQCGQIRLSYCYHARLQIHLNLRRFPFDSQRLPIHLRMPSEKDQDRAFVYRSSRLCHTARRLDEWLVDGIESHTDHTTNTAQATLEICIRRRSGYYVVSVLSVLMGISSLMFVTVLTVEVHANNQGVADQGKILVPLLMTLLAFKLLIASGKIPKAAYATIFDRIMMTSEALFFMTMVFIVITMILALNPATASSANSFRIHACVLLLVIWIFHAFFTSIDVRCNREGGPNSSMQQMCIDRVTPAFEKQRNCLTQQNSNDILVDLHTMQCPLAPVLLQITIKQVHSMSATTGSFVCEFDAFMAWLNPAAKDWPAGEPLSPEQLQELRMPALWVPNSLTCKQTILGGAVVDPATGHVAVQVRSRAQLQLAFQLEDFPVDTQALAVVLALADPRDVKRSLVIHSCENRDAVKISEWSVLGTFAGSSRQDSIAQLAFGVTIHRDSRYYVTSGFSLCLWSTFVFSIYVLDFEQFTSRGKILVGVILLSIVSKLAVSSKLPRIARLTSYDRVALNSLAMLFGVGCSAALWHWVGRLGIQGLDRMIIQRLDQATGVLLFLTWVSLNLRIVRRMRQAISVAGRPPSSSLPKGFFEPPSSSRRASGCQDLPAADEVPVVAEDLQLLRGAPRPFGSLGEPVCNSPRGRNTRRRSSDVQSPELHMISLGVKLWMVCNVDASIATFECKFHVFLEWLAPAAMGLPEGMRIGGKGKDSGEGPSLKDTEQPRITIRNAIAVMMEDYSDVEVRNSMTGQVACRIQYHVKVHHRFSLRWFPFDCQRLELDLKLQNCRERFLVSDFCLADDQTNHLDGWRLAALSMVHGEHSRQQMNIQMLVERESQYYVTHVIVVFFFLTTLLFSFFLMKPDKFDNRIVDVLKIVLTQTTFRFSVEHRLPKVQHWTPFDIYVLSCQALCCFIVLTFVYSAFAVQDKTRILCVQRQEQLAMYSLLGIWFLWNVIAAVLAWWVKKREMSVLTHQEMAGGCLRDRKFVAIGRDSFRGSMPSNGTNSDRSSVASSFSLGSGSGHWEQGPADAGAELTPQVVSVAFRIWLVRNVDLVTATFECKFRVFLEWLDEDAIGLPAGKKAKLPVPTVTITNSVQSQIIDKSSAPEVVNSTTGHLAAQILYRATLRMDQEVHQFPFDCQWLAITLSLRDEGLERNRSFMFQYCEVDGQLQLDEWQVYRKPAFSTLSKQDAPSIQDTVMCGILIRRCARYYAVNILGMLFLISSMAFAIYTIDVTNFWERAEVFLGIFPLIVIFKMSAQGKLPRVGYSTKFDHYATACQILFMVLVLGSVIATVLIEMGSVPPLSCWLAPCSAPDYDQTCAAAESEGTRNTEVMKMNVKEIEKWFWKLWMVLWLAWNMYFIFQAWRVLRLPPLTALKSPMQIRLQDNEHLLKCSGEGNPDVNGLAPQLSLLATRQRSIEDSQALLDGDLPQDAEDPKGRKDLRQPTGEESMPTTVMV